MFIVFKIIYIVNGKKIMVFFIDGLESLFENKY